MEKSSIKNLLSFAVALLAPVLSFSQINVGVKAGIHANSFRDEHKVYLFGNQSTPGYDAGVFASYRVISFLSARAEVLYFTQGGRLEDYSYYGGVKRTKAILTLHTVQVPVIIGLNIPSLEGNAIQPKLFLGGYYAATINATESYKENASVAGYEISNSRTSSVSSSITANQGGWIVGAVIEFGKYQAEFRYTQNMSSMNTINAGYTGLSKTIDQHNGKLLTSSFSFNLSMTLFQF